MYVCMSYLRQFFMYGAEFFRRARGPQGWYVHKKSNCPGGDTQNKFVVSTRTIVNVSNAVRVYYDCSEFSAKP